jgi:hypothetical protein
VEGYEEIINADIDDFFLKFIFNGRTLIHGRKGLKQRDIVPQRNRTEQESNQIKKEGISPGYEIYNFACPASATHYQQGHRIP